MKRRRIQVLIILLLLAIVAAVGILAYRQISLQSLLDVSVGIDYIQKTTIRIIY